MARDIVSTSCVLFYVNILMDSEVTGRYINYKGIRFRFGKRIFESILLKLHMNNRQSK